jgi:hypothetical protein
MNLLRHSVPAKPMCTNPCSQVILDVSNLPGGGSSYLSGDELAVWAENPAEAVTSVAAGLALHGSRLDAMFLLQRVEFVHPSAPGADVHEDDKVGTPPPASAAEVDDGGLDCAPFPLPNSYRTILTRYVALCDKPSYEAMRALPLFAPEASRPLTART